MSTGAFLRCEITPAGADRLSRVAQVSRLISRLPAVPTHDWCDQAAGTLAAVVPDGLGVVVIADLDQTGLIKAAWVGGVGPTEPPGDPALIEFRCRLDTVRGSAWGGGPGRTMVVGAAETGPLEPAWRSLGAPSVVMGAAPMSPDGPWLLAAVGSTAPAEESGVEALAALLPLLADVARGALGCARRREADWVTSREQEVLDLLVMGYSVREIAQKLSRSPHTVHDHVKNLHRKLQASSRGELVALALGRVPERAERA